MKGWRFSRQLASELPLSQRDGSGEKVQCQLYIGLSGKVLQRIGDHIDRFFICRMRWYSNWNGVVWIPPLTLWLCRHTECRFGQPASWSISLCRIKWGLIFILPDTFRGNLLGHVFSSHGPISTLRSHFSRLIAATFFSFHVLQPG
jgi:hypothetical protein